MVQLPVLARRYIGLTEDLKFISVFSRTDAETEKPTGYIWMMRKSFADTNWNSLMMFRREKESIPEKV